MIFFEFVNFFVTPTLRIVIMKIYKVGMEIIG